MVQQLVLSQMVKKQVNNFSESAKTESKNFNATACFTGTQLVALDSLASERGCSRSKVISDCVEFYMNHYEHADKLDRYLSTIVSMLETLP